MVIDDLSLKWLTIVIALKDDALLLRSTLDSISSQEGLDDIKVIVMDCNSIDDPYSVVSSFKNQLDITYFSEYDSGIYSAWNKSLKHSKSEWVTFLGAGDLLLLNAIVELKKISRDIKSPTVISSKSQIIYGNGTKKVSGKEYKLDEFSLYFTTNHSGLLYSRKIFYMYGNFNEKYKSASDYEFLLRIGTKINFRFLDRVISEYPYGGISSNSINPLIEIYNIRKKHTNIRWYKNVYIFLYGYLALNYRKYFFK